MDLPLVMDEGGGAFYGPKISVQARDAIGRTWQMSTIQVDFQLPQRFDLHYAGDDGERHRPVMIHRALFGSVERFFGVLTEHYAGAFPLWLAPEQLRLVPVADRHVEPCHELAAEREGRRAARGGRRLEGERRQEDPGRPADEGALHARGRRPRARGRHVHGPRPRRAPRSQGVPFDRIVEALVEEAASRAPRADRLRGGLMRAWSTSGARGGWSTSRPTRDELEDDGGCVFCACCRRLDEPERCSRAATSRSSSLAKYPYNPGHLLILPLRHTGDARGPDRRGELGDRRRCCSGAVRALREASAPHGFNVGHEPRVDVAGAGIPEHLHWHVVPRWGGDTNFMPVVGETRVLPELLGRDRPAAALRRFADD